MLRGAGREARGGLARLGTEHRLAQRRTSSPRARLARRNGEERAPHPLVASVAERMRAAEERSREIEVREEERRRRLLEERRHRLELRFAALLHPLREDLDSYNFV